MCPVQFIFFGFEQITVGVLVSTRTISETITRTIVRACVVATAVDIQRAVVLHGTATPSVYPQRQALIVKPVAKLTTSAGLGGAEPLVDGLRGSDGRLVNSPVEEEHDEHWNEEGSHGRVDDIVGIIVQFTFTRIGP